MLNSIIKRRLTALFIFCPVLALGAQDPPNLIQKGIVEVVRPSVSLELKGGLSITDAWYTVNSFLVGPQYGYRYGVGADVNIFLFENLSACLGAYFEPRTIGINQQGTVVYMTRNTLLLPVTAHYSILPLLSLIAGGYMGIAISDWSYSVANPPATANANPVEFGWVLGVQLRYPLVYSKSYLLKLVAELSYYSAMTNIARSPIEDFRYRDYHFDFGIAVDL